LEYLLKAVFSAAPCACLQTRSHKEHCITWLFNAQLNNYVLQCTFRSPGEFRSETVVMSLTSLDSKLPFCPQHAQALCSKRHDQPLWLLINC